MVNGYTLTHNAMSFNDRCIVNCWRENKIALTGAQQSQGIPRKTANIILFYSVLFTEIYLFTCKKCFPTI